MRRMLRIFAIAALLVLCAGLQLGVQAQKMPERGLVRKGNRQFDRGNFQRSIERYTQALACDSLSFEARYDLGNALFRTERFDAAQQMLAAAAADTTRTAEERAEAFFNLGDVQFSQQNLQGALESFKNALRLNPSDMEAKYNYAYTKKLLEQQQNDDQNQQNDQNQDQNNQQNNQNQNQNDNNDRNQDQNEQQGDNNEQQGDNDQEQQDRNQDQQQGDGEQRQQQGQISPEQLEAMLDAIQAQEDKTQEKVKEKQGVIIRGKKNW